MKTILRLLVFLFEEISEVLRGARPVGSVRPTLLRAALLIAALPLMQACEVIDYHPYDADFRGACDINARNVERIEQTCAGRTRLRFAVISDTQRWYDETAAAVKSINGRGDIDFVIHCGDLTDFGATREFVWMRDELEKLVPPYVCLLGNHDCLATGVRVFRRMYGNPDFSFTAGDVHFVCVNTNALEYDYSVPVPDFAFLRADRDALPPGVRRTVVAMHAAPFSDQFNNNSADVFEYHIRRYPALQFCLCGHQHSTTVFEPFGDGVLYYECGAAKHRQYLVFTLEEGKEVGYEVVSY